MRRIGFPRFPLAAAVASTTVLLTLLSLAGCGTAGGGTAAPAPTAPAAKPASANTPAGGAAAAPTARPPRLKVAIGTPSRELAHLTPQVAIKAGFFEQENIEATFTQAKGSAIIAGLMSGDLDYVTSFGSTLTAAVKGEDLKAIMVLTNRPLFSLVVRSGIERTADLKGRSIASTGSPGDTQDRVTRLMLQAYGFDPQKDVSIAYLGDNPARLAAMQAGLADATLLAPPNDVLAVNEGMKILDSAADHVEIPQSGLGTTGRKLREKPEEVERFLRAIYRAQQFILTQKEPTVKIIMDWLELDEPTASRSYDLATKAFARDGLASVEALEAYVADTSKTAGVQGPVGLDKVRDFTILEKVQKDLQSERR